MNSWRSYTANEISVCCHDAAKIIKEACDVKGNDWSAGCTKAANYKVCPSSMVDVSPCDRFRGQRLRGQQRYGQKSELNIHSMDWIFRRFQRRRRYCQSVLSKGWCLAATYLVRRCSSHPVTNSKMHVNQFHKCPPLLAHMDSYSGSYSEQKFELVKTKLAVTSRYTMISRMQEC
jgi:hypothetical protein